MRLWQAICSLVTFVPPEESRDTILAIFDMLSVRPLLPVACLILQEDIVNRLMGGSEAS